jgi:hypothetical protein
MAQDQDLEQEQKNLFQRINSVYFLSVKTDDGRTVFQIPMWTIVAGIIILVALMITGRKRPNETEEE